MKAVLEEICFCICGAIIALGMCLLYWACRLFGIRLEDDF